jgi:hypothetical protein
MKKSRGFFILMTIILVSSVSALCETGQIDVNTATAEELDKIVNVGNATALKIIGARPFSSVDDLIRIKGIGNVTLSEIKAQGLACVENEESDNKEEANKPEVNQTKNNAVSDFTNTSYNSPLVEQKEPEIIILNSKDIKGTENTESSSRRSYAVYGFVAFVVLLCVLFIIKEKKYKNEFR